MGINYLQGRRLGKLYGLWIALCFLCGNAVAAPALDAEQLQKLQSLSPAQRQTLQNLSPEQQKQLLEAAGKTNGDSSAQPLTEPQIVTPVTKKNKLEESSDKAEDEIYESGNSGTAQPNPDEETIKTEKKLAADSSKNDSLDNKKSVKKEEIILQPYGYDLFEGVPTTFAPATDIPIPADYIVGPGDTVQVQLFGKENSQYTLVITREGLMQFPGIGPIAVAGLRFEELKSVLEERIEKQLLGLKASITMGALRSIRIFVLGEANHPGSYTVSALSTMTNALFVSGGVKSIGSLRNIQLKRNGKVVTTLDLYKLLLQGDTSSDTRLMPGDVIFIPPVGVTAGIGGEVRRPNIYELKSEKTAKEVLALAGGVLPTAYPQASKIERINKKGERTIIDVDLSPERVQDVKVNNGDLIQVYSILEKMEDIVVLSGHVERPGGQQWRPGMRLNDLIPKVEALLAKPDLNYALIKRESGSDRRIEVFSVNLAQGLSDPTSPQNVLLHKRDEVIVFSINEDRNSTIQYLIEQLKQQASFDNPEPVVKIEGNVRFPGNYPLEQGMRVSNLLAAAGDLLSETDAKFALLIRERDYGSKIESLFFQPSEARLEKNGSQDLELQPRDTVLIFKDREDKQTKLESLLTKLSQQAQDSELARIVAIDGTVQDPGRYPMAANMRISDLLRAANGLKESAYTLAAELTHYAIIDGQYQKIAHVPVELAKVLAGDPGADLILQPYDHLTIKQLPAWGEREKVEILGEVRFPGVYPISRGETLSSVLQRAGGVTNEAFLDGAVLTREELRIKEQQQLDQLASRLESDIAAASVARSAELDAKEQQSLTLAKEMLTTLRNTKAQGRLVIDFPSVVDATDRENKIDGDVVIKNQDKIYIPSVKQEVSVLGEVFYPTSHLYRGDLARRDYINLSGGMTRRADSSLIYVVRANGSVISAKAGRGWFSGSGAQTIKPGDTIVVPVDVERVRPIALWTSVSQIVYQLALAAASANAVGIF